MFPNYLREVILVNRIDIWQFRICQSGLRLINSQDFFVLFHSDCKLFIKVEQCWYVKGNNLYNAIQTETISYMTAVSTTELLTLPKHILLFIAARAAAADS